MSAQTLTKKHCNEQKLQWIRSLIKICNQWGLMLRQIKQNDKSITIHFFTTYSTWRSVHQAKCERFLYLPLDVIKYLWGWILFVELLGQFGQRGLVHLHSGRGLMTTWYSLISGNNFLHTFLPSNTHDSEGHILSHKTEPFQCSFICISTNPDRQVA